MVGKFTNRRALKTILKMLHLVSAICITGAFLCMLVILLMKTGNHFDGTEIIYNKVLLGLFNTLIIYGAMLLVITIFAYSLFTEWGFFRFRFIIVKWIATLLIFVVAWFFLGSAISGMASLSDANLHQGAFRAQYLGYYYQALASLAAELVLLASVIYLSIRKPFGQRSTTPFKYKKAVIGVLIPVVLLGITMAVQGEIRHTNLRNTSVSDIDVQQIPDGEYIGESTFGIEFYVSVWKKWLEVSKC